MTLRTRLLVWVFLSLVAAIWTDVPAWGQRSSEAVAIELMQRWDANQDGQLAADEIPSRARPALDRIARQAGLDSEGPWPLERLQKQLQKQTRRAEKGKDRGSENQRRRPSPTEPAAEASTENPGEADAAPDLPAARVPGFGQWTGERNVRGFDDGATAGTPPARAESKPAAPSNTDVPAEAQREANGDDARIRRLAQGLLRRYDRNRSGVLEKEEWSRMRGDPAASDTNRDGILTEDELATRLADYGRGSRTSSATEPKRSPTPSPARGGVGERAAREQGGRPSQRFLTATERLAQTLPRELRDWFLEKDRDGDGQVAMSEFGSVWSEQQAREFARLDLDNDGLITPREYVRAKGTP